MTITAATDYLATGKIDGKKAVWNAFKMAPVLFAFGYLGAPVYAYFKMPPGFKGQLCDDAANLADDAANLADDAANLADDAKSLADDAKNLADDAKNLADDASRVGTDIPKPGSLTNQQVRRWYLDQEARIPDIIDESLSIEQQAKQAFNFRNQIRTQAREAMADQVMAERLFGSYPNMTWEQVVEKYTGRGFSGDALYQEIIAAAQRSNPEVNNMLNIFPE